MSQASDPEQLDEAIRFAQTIAITKESIQAVYVALRRQGFGSSVAKQALETLDRSETPNAKILSEEMREAYDLAFDLHMQGKNFQSILAALGENSSIDFDERLEVIELLETEGNTVAVANTQVWAVPVSMVGGLIFIGAGVWLILNEHDPDGYIFVISGTNIPVRWLFWLPVAMGIFIILGSIFEAVKLYRQWARRKAKN